ncbi:MAG: ethanolamine ammonia-lyase reactivating factor EutA [Candidatus Melainabacteria bacterium]|nr:ethanolamine ammonia-lyase reactivating factor EutA [Candidatus Melainabacteria bacterium]
MTSSKTPTSKNSLTSVGIDIGTTSCHLVFSRLSLVNEASATQIPRLVIGERSVLYQSPIFFTPLNDDGSIDGAAVSAIMRSEYSRAGFTPDDINCGAVIITGETARLRNAEAVLDEISSLAGDFVAASAGPQLESILAGRGSGAFQYSKDTGKTICNIDIGGGTTNIAVFRNGALVETACLRIGARCLQFTKQGELTRVSAAGKTLIDCFAAATSTGPVIVTGTGTATGNGIETGVGAGTDFSAYTGNSASTAAGTTYDIRQVVPTNTLKLLANDIATFLINFVATENHAANRSYLRDAEVSASPVSLLPQNLLLGDTLTKPFSIDEYWLSGGVAELMNESLLTEKSMTDDYFRFEDFGCYLADGLKHSIAEHHLPHTIANNPIRATVLGAGSYSVQLSGNTISAGVAKLPLKGVPLIRPFQNLADQINPDSETISPLLYKAITVHCQNVSAKSFAIVLHLNENPRFEALKKWAMTLSHACKTNNLRLPYIIVINTDSAMALGQLMQGELGHKEVIVLDGIDLSNGDYIDIGKPLSNGSSIPVTIKSLVFSNE